MPSELSLLLATASSIAVLHTLAGPDHYLPFIVLAKTRQWSLKTTILWTLLCGAGHVASSVLLGLVGAAIGISLSSLAGVEEVRGSIAGWILMGFGLLYCVWGLWRLNVQPSHRHFDIEDDGKMYIFSHRHDGKNLSGERHPVTPWVMFLIFVLGPCEPMIPLLYFPAAVNLWYGMAILILVYTFFTLASMTFMVLLGHYGLFFVKTEKLHKYMHLIGGCSILLCGAGILFLEW